MPDWQFAAENKAVLAYLYANPELGFVGYTDGTFRPFNEISAMEYYKVLLTALGYEQNVDYVYGDDLLDFAASLGLSEVADVEEFAVVHLATATVEALKAVVKDGEETLLDKLVADGVIDEDVAAETGIYEGEVVAAELAVESVTADNLAEVYVKFNQAMDKTTVKAENFKVGGGQVQNADLLADGVTVKLTVAQAKVAANGSSYKVEITKNVKSASGKNFADGYSTTTAKIFDRTSPVLEGFELTGPQTIVLTFSEPIKTAGEVKINKGIYGCSIDTIDKVTNEVIVRIAATKLPEATYNLTVTGFKDYAEFKMDDDEIDLAYAADMSPITAQVVEAKQEQVVIKFNKRVVLAGTLKTYFYHTFNTFNPNTVTPDADGQTFTLDFTTYPIKEGTTQLIIKTKGETTSEPTIEDEWGNKLEDRIKLDITVKADTEPPAVKEIKVVSQTQITVEFTEAVTPKSAEEKANYVIEDLDGNKATISSISYSSKVATIDLEKELSGDYNISIKGVIDASLSGNEMVPYTSSLFVKDMKAPDYTAVKATAVEKTAESDSDVIYVTYPEKMCTDNEKPYSVLLASNYMLSDKSLPAGTKLDMFDDTTVRITIPKANKQEVEGKTLAIGRVGDLAGNLVTAMSFYANNGLAAADPYKDKIKPETPPAVASIAQTDKNKLEIKVNTKLLSVLPNTFGFQVGSAVYYFPAGVDEWTNNKDGTATVKVTLTHAFIDKLDDVNPNYGVVTSTTVSDVTGVTLTIFGDHIVSAAGMKGSTGLIPLTVDDKWSPSLIAQKPIKGDSTKKVITVKFTEDINDYAGDPLQASKLALYAQDLVVADAKGNAKTAGIDYVTTVNSGELVITLQGTLEADSNWTVKTKDAITYIKDKAGNKINTFSATKVSFD
jgi:membrane-bound inhibitor of C-type lysozyme